MKPFRKIAAGLFGFDRRERRGTYVLSVILIIFLLVRLTAFRPGRVPEDLGEIAHAGINQQSAAEDEVSDRAIFTFDPNTLTYDSLLLLGLSEKQAGTLIRYREAGATFRRPEDLRRVYGIDSADATRLIPYIVIVSRPEVMGTVWDGRIQTMRGGTAAAARDYRYAGDASPRAVAAGSPEETSRRGGGEELRGVEYQRTAETGMSEGRYQRTAETAMSEGRYQRTAETGMSEGGYQRTAETGMSEGVYQRTAEMGSPGSEHLRIAEAAGSYSGRPQRGMIDINRCSAGELISLPGIGPVLSERIIKYRNLLGGFVDKQQLKEVYGIDTAVVSLIAPRVTLTLDSVKPLILDSASFGDLARHPYVGYEAARLITRYRTIAGVPLTLGAMVSSNVITSQQAERMAPYVRPSAEAAGTDYEFISSKVLK